MEKNTVNQNYQQIIEDIARRIKNARLESGKTQGKVAIHLGQSQSYISKIESGNQPVTAAELKLLADFYKLSITDFFD